ncbi:hypothetical protein FRB90_006428 [Tulasnella sp. 427]|nr:hypothetical protein FRB90_006428 [Tulasnella sp. 427]
MGKLDQSSQATALSLVDILVVIFFFAKKRHLASAARVCKTWKEPALNALWKKLSSPFPLLELIGPMVYEERGWSFQDGLENPNWDLWLYYAKRVRCLDIADMAHRKGRNSIINPEVATYLLSSFKGWGSERLIPNVQLLGLQCYFPSTPSLALVFIAPSVKSLDFFVLDSPSKVLRSVRKVLMSLIAMRDVIKLHDLTIHFDETRERRTEFEDVLIKFLGSQPEISSFAFGVLREGTPLATYLDTIPALKVLSLSGPYSASEAGLVKDMTIVAQHSNNLEYFNYFGVREDSSLGSVLFSLPRPLLRCTNLKTLVLGCIHPVSITGSLIKDMAAAWPCMESIELLPDVPLEHIRGISPERLIDFAAAFSATIQNISITISFDNFVSLPIPPSPTKFIQLRTLAVGFSVIRKELVQQFVGLLDGLTEHGLFVRSYHEEDIVQSLYWAQVDSLLRERKRGYNSQG